ncbi:MAG: hypothetical protein EHM61_14025 [Acidobacteria bacterium]|nr:MAG: hypothetical protein EHM61_14025 [Acidobacteriota bacterium]
MAHQDIWALIVGIDKYISPTVRSLSGCRNDAEALRLFLLEYLNVPQRQIRVLTNAQATRSAILGSFAEFLIDNDEIQRGSQILIHYSGHGSQMPNTTGTEPDGRDETIVPHDSRVGDVFDIPDKTLAQVIKRLSERRGDNITVILDCCHSGSGTRGLAGAQTVATRRAPFDERRPPADLDFAWRPGTAARGVGGSGWAATAQNHVLVAGCLDREESHEHWTGEVHHGALTFFLLQYLRQLGCDATYADLHSYLRNQVTALYPLQTPQCEGQRDRVILGGATVQATPFIRVRLQAPDLVLVGAGIAHGLTPGSQIAIYPPMATSGGVLPAPLGTATVTSVSGTEGTAKLDSAPSQPLPAEARGLVSRQAIASSALRVVLSGGDGDAALEEVRLAIANSRGAGQASPYVEVVSASDTSWNASVRVEQGGYCVRDSNGRLTVKPIPVNNRAAAKVREALESIARFRIVAEMENSGKSRFAGQFEIRLRKYRPKCKPSEMELVRPDSQGSISLSYVAGLPELNWYVVEVWNRSPLPFYPHIFIMSEDFSIKVLYPVGGQNEALNPGASLFTLPEMGGHALDVYLPGDLPDEERWDSSRDRIKVIVTQRPCDVASVLQQGPLEVPAPRSARGGSQLEQFLAAVAAGSGTRHGRPQRTDVGEEWATASLSYTLSRVTESVTMKAAPAVIRLGEGVTVEKPHGLEGLISAEPLTQAARGTIGAESVRPPTALRELRDAFAPVVRGGGRGFDDEPLMFTIQTEPGSSRFVSSNTPLRLRLREEADDFLPVVFDGEDYLPAGHGSGSNVVDIVRLPEPAGGSEGTTRGLTKTLRLFVYRKIGRPARDTGLRVLEIDAMGYRYRPVDASRFRRGDRVALMVHGFLSDSGWMARDVAPVLQSEVRPYEHFLTCDYETFGTSVEEHGRDLATALRQQCGFKPGTEITLHVFAHGMGALVSRWAAEMAGAEEIVGRMILAGPPNRGTSLASISRSGAYLLAAILNGLAPVPLVGAVAWTMEKLCEHGLGWRDLETDSALTKQLNELNSPASVPYFVLAGNMPSEGPGSRLARLARKLFDKSLDGVLGERENDGVVPMSSLKGLRGGTYTLLTTCVLPCDHFSYFVVPEARAAMRQWILNRK